MVNLLARLRMHSARTKMAQIFYKVFLTIYFPPFLCMQQPPSKLSRFLRIQLNLLGGR